MNVNIDVTNGVIEVNEVKNYIIFKIGASNPILTISFNTNNEILFNTIGVHLHFVYDRKSNNKIKPLLEVNLNNFLNVIKNPELTENEFKGILTFIREPNNEKNKEVVSKWIKNKILNRIMEEFFSNIVYGLSKKFESQYSENLNFLVDGILNKKFKVNEEYKLFCALANKRYYTKKCGNKFYLLRFKKFRNYSLCNLVPKLEDKFNVDTEVLDLDKLMFNKFTTDLVYEDDETLPVAKYSIVVLNDKNHKLNIKTSNIDNSLFNDYKKIAHKITEKLDNEINIKQESDLICDLIENFYSSRLKVFFSGIEENNAEKGEDMKTTTLMGALKEDILNRYNNKDHWNVKIIKNYILNKGYENLNDEERSIAKNLCGDR